MAGGEAVRAFMEAAVRHPLRWQHVTRESAASLPVPVRGEGGFLLALFFYPVGGPIHDRRVQPPTHRARARLGDVENIVFEPAAPEAFGLRVPPTLPIGTMQATMSRDEYEALTDAYCRLTEALLPVHLEPPQRLDAQRRAQMRELAAHFSRLAHPALRPAYRSLNPAYFDWLGL